MENGGVHIGFGEAGPDEAVWAGGSFVRRVHDMDRRNMKRACTVIVLGAIGMFPAAGIVLALGWAAGKYVGVSEATDNVFTAIAGVLIVCGIVSCMFLGQILKWVMLRKIRSRGESLFDPDWGCFYVGIENVFTYDKMKVTPEDFALIKIEPGAVLMEMTDYRGYFKASELNASVLHVGKNIAGVRLTVSDERYSWSVVTESLGNSWNILKMASGAGRARHLLERLIEAGCGTQTSTVSASVEVPAEGEGGVEADKDILRVPEVIAESAPNADVMDKRHQAVAEVIRRMQGKRKKGWIKSAGILLISLLIFFQLGFFKWGMEAVLAILLVLFVHELGHFVGMKIFGYKNVQMFFIPLVGAAVSGQSRNPAGWKKAIVSLLGPLPGIGIGCAVLVGYMVTGREMLFVGGLMFVGLNLLNLLPIYPLDGGRFMHEVVFSRNRYLELVMNILAAGVLLLAGFGLGSLLLKILGFLNLFTIRYKFNLAGTANRFKTEWLAGDEGGAERVLEDAGEEEIPEGLLRQMLDWIYKSVPGAMKPKAAATTAIQLWDRVRVQPPGAGATAGLLVAFVMAYFVSLVFVGATAVFYAKRNMFSSKIVEVVAVDGTVSYKEQDYYMGKLSAETELSEDKELYHGDYRYYDYEGDLLEEGQWEMGMRSGEWRYYDPNGVVIEERHYEEGRPILRKMLEDGEWTEMRWEDFSEVEREYYEWEAQEEQGPGRSPDYNYFDYVEDANSAAGGGMLLP